VIVDHDATEHLNTARDGNPTQLKLDELVVHSVYKRLKNSAKFSKDRQQKAIGDNCPLIYAVKGSDGLSTNVASTKRLLEHTQSIISDICEKIDGQVDGLVTMPSGFPLANWLAKRIQREMELPIFPGVFRKSTKTEAAARAEALIPAQIAGVDREKRRQLINAVKRVRKTEGNIYTAKLVPPSLRTFFDPIQWQGLNCPNTHRLLLVDDLLASGGTFLAAKSILETQGWTSPRHAVTWFSAV
jgi:adenine/guanine phosphoribosyltransferase-like PRPP-binding protein